MYTIEINPQALALLQEPSFALFKHSGLWCMVCRNMHMGFLCGYVAVEKDHPFFGMGTRSKVYVPNFDDVAYNGNILSLFCRSSTDASLGFLSLDAFIQVHCGLTWAANNAGGVDEGTLGDLWWFGFDCGHSRDISPFEYKFPGLPSFSPIGYTYRTFGYVIDECKRLANQLCLVNADITKRNKKGFFDRLRMGIRTLNHHPSGC